jgi:hypothetical protein
MILKKITAAAFFVLVGLVLPSSALAATLSLEPSTATVNKNCNFSVNITLNTQNQDTDGTDVILTYDTTKFSVSTASIVNGKIYTDYPGNSVTNGKISISGIAPPSQQYNGTGTFATLNVTVLGTAAGTGTFKFEFDPNDKTKTTDTNVVQGGVDPVDILSQVIDGTYTIGTGTTCTTTSGGGGGGGINGGGGGAAGSKTLPPGTRQGAPVGSSLYPGGPATDSGNLVTTLPNTGLTDYTYIIAAVGAALTVLGAIGLAML